MKKILFILLLIPLNILAYSENIMIGGDNIGININTKGVTIVGFYKVNGKYIASDTLRVGDTILEIEGTPVNSINELSSNIDKNIKDNKVNILIKRNNKEVSTTLNLVKVDDMYKTGLYVKEKLTGVGTLSYVDVNSKVYGSLGHSIIFNESDNNVEVRSGEIYKSYVSGIDRSFNGNVGSKNASIDYNTSIGSITKNTPLGIFGIYNGSIKNEILPVANIDDITLGKAYIHTVTSENIVNLYEIEITNINYNALKTNKSITFKVTDEKLLEISGGIVQGMSGSPITQNGKIIGAVTHVVVDDVTKGYAVFIRTMLEEGEK